MADRYYISKRIGDGSEGNHFRPEIADKSDNWMAVEMEDGTFLVLVLDDPMPNVGDIEVNEKQLKEQVAERAPKYAGKGISIGGRKFTVNEAAITP